MDIFTINHEIDLSLDGIVLKLVKMPGFLHFILEIRKIRCFIKIGTSVPELAEYICHRIEPIIKSHSIEIKTNIGSDPLIFSKNDEMSGIHREILKICKDFCIIENLERFID
jgi:hypothetical protein